MSSKCPCCGQAVSVPTLPVLAQAYGLSGMEVRVLDAVWSGNGRPVPTPRIFNAMYWDDIDGGPSEGVMYNSLRTALCKANRKLEPAGVRMESAGYRKGWRLVMMEPSHV